MWFLETDQFIARVHCAVGGWPPYLRIVNQYSNLAIALSYVFIASSLLYLWIGIRHRYPRTSVLFAFASFIGFCALTHYCNYLSFSFPAYRLFTLTDFITAMISLIVAVSLPPIISFMKRLPSIQDLVNANNIAQEEILKRALIEKDHLELIAQLTNSTNLLELELKSVKWVDKKYENLEKIKKILEGV